MKKKKEKLIIKEFNAESFHINNRKVRNCFTRGMIQNVSKVISLKTASDKFVADDPNITKSTAMSNVKD